MFNITRTVQILTYHTLDYTPISNPAEETLFLGIGFSLAIQVARAPRQPNRGLTFKPELSTVLSINIK